jgi:neuronal cell adhesion molecule
VPNPPEIIRTTCRKMEAKIKWRHMGDNRSPITHYNVQYNTTFTPDTWVVASDNVPATELSYSIHMSPGANYTFRIIAFNDIGPSLPSMHSNVCSTLPDVPFSSRKKHRTE